MLILGTTVLTVDAQIKYLIDNTNSSLIVEGTSSVHDWEMKVNDLKSNVVLQFNENKLAAIENATFTCRAEKVLSGNSIMNSKTHKALKAEKYPEITFNLKSVSGLKVNGHSIAGQATGVLKVAGIAQNVKINFSGKINPGHLFSISGSVPLKMSDYKIDPPTAMLGALKTGDEVKINFKFLYKNL